MNRTCVLVCVAAWLALATEARGQEPGAGVKDMDVQARALVEALAGGGPADGSLPRAGSSGGGVLDMEELGRWADAVIAGAVGGTETGGPDPTPAVPAGTAPGAGAGALAPARTGTAEVIVFASLSMPEASWRQWSRQAARIGTPLVLRGLGEGGFARTVERIAGRRAGDGAGATVDPRLFRLFRIAHVPAVAVVPGGVPPCTSPGCSREAPPPHDVVTGNVGLESALRIVAGEDGPGRDTARRHLARLNRESE